MTAAGAAASRAGDTQPSKTGRRQHAVMSPDSRAEQQLAKFVDHMPAWLTEGIVPTLPRNPFVFAQRVSLYQWKIWLSTDDTSNVC